MTRQHAVTSIGAALLALVLAPAIGSAQDHPVHVNFGGGSTFIGGDLGNHFKTGWGPAIGVSVNIPNKRLAIQFEYAYRWFDINDELDAKGGVLDANHQTHQLDFNLIANLTPNESSRRVYVIVGPGAYNRKVEITEYEGNGIVCDPYWYICGTYPISSVVGSRGGWDFGINVGGGIGFKFAEYSEFYIESRFHYVIGPEIKPEVNPLASATGTSSSNGYYFPLTFGFRF